MANIDPIVQAKQEFEYRLFRAKSAGKVGSEIQVAQIVAVKDEGVGGDIEVAALDQSGKRIACLGTITIKHNLLVTQATSFPALTKG